MAYYYKIDNFEDALPLYKGFHLEKSKKTKNKSGPKINYDFSKHVLIELLDDTTPEAKLWQELGLTNNKNVLHKRMMFDCHRIKCRRAVVICSSSDEAKQLAKRVTQTKVVNRCICASVIKDLLSDLCLFEKQVRQFGDDRQQQQLLYVSDLSRSRGPAGLTAFLKEKFSPFGTILSILVCSDDNGYAYPEGVIKFAYLSEAFAAELAFDQHVVGKERLTVTTHHNILLSQCDLRVRLRDAQWQNNLDYDAGVESPFRSYQETSALNNLGATREDPVVDSMNNLQISQLNNAANFEDNSIGNASEFFPPAFSQVNFDQNITKDELDLDTVEKPKDAVTVLFKSAKVLKTNCASQAIDGNSKINNSDQIKSKVLKCPSVLSSMKSNRLGKTLNSKISKDMSESLSFTTCKDFPASNPDSVFSSCSKSTVYDSILSSDIFSMSEYQSMTSKSILQIPKSCNNILNDSRKTKESAAKGSNKRKKKYTPSQKLCLKKNQRTDINQSNAINTCTEGNVSDSNSSQPDKIEKGDKSDIKKILNVTNLSRDTVEDSSRVIDWLSQLPEMDNTTLPFENINPMEVDVPNKKTAQSGKGLGNRISLHRAPSIRSNYFIDREDSLSDSSVENQDPNRHCVVLCGDKQPPPCIDKSKTPLQVWLKQELMLSTTNRAVKSQETLKSSILCAARTKDVVIAVGCSHMTCDSCYPESTGLLLGYN